MSQLEIITTGDGSHSLLNTSLNETYHSVHGALQESRYVFIQQGLAHLLQQRTAQPIDIFEVGFGTGLNAWLAMRFCRDTRQPLNYTSVETEPLQEEIWRAMNYGQTESERNDYALIHRAKWNETESPAPGFTIKKLHADIHALGLTPSCYDLVFFDAFGPAKQPDMWELPVLAKIAEAMKAGGIFVTYCARGQVKRDLKSAGLRVETLPGAPGKREMVRAVKI